MNARQKQIADLCDGVLTSKQIAQYLGDSAKYVQRTMLKFDLPRRQQGAQLGEDNHSFVSGRRIDRDGYVLTSAPVDHPHARKRKDRNVGVILEHRLIMEQCLGRYLQSGETVDHIDGLRLHNSPENLRLFSSNAEHLKKTITGQIPSWSEQGKKMINHSVVGRERVDSYLKMKRSGDARLQQILLAALLLGTDSPFLLGTLHHLEKAGIVDLSRSSLQRELDDLYQRYA